MPVARDYWGIPVRMTVVSACAMAALTACAGDRAGSGPVALPVPAAEGSGESHLAVAPDGTVVLSWLEPVEGGHALRFATLGTGGWSPASTVAVGEHWFVNWADFPSVEPISDTLWAAHWLARQPAGGYAYDVTVALSTDGGGHWGDPFLPHTDGTPTEHGFVTLFPWQGTAGAVWLDGRHMAVEGGAEGGGAHAHGGMTLRAAQLGADGSRSHEQEVDGLVCDCCQTDVAIAANGPVLVYRDRSEGEIRDIYLARAGVDGWSEPVPVAMDGWRIDGCPVNGPAVAADGQVVVVAWFTAAEGLPRVRLARSSDGGARFSDPVDVDTAGPLGRVDVALLPDGEAVVSWLRPAGEGGAAVSIRRVGSDGRMGTRQDVARTGAGRPSGFPQMVYSTGRLVLSWTETDETGKRVRSVSLDPAGI